MRCCIAKIHEGMGGIHFGVVKIYSEMVKETINLANSCMLFLNQGEPKPTTQRLYAASIQQTTP